MTRRKDKPTNDASASGSTRGLDGSPKRMKRGVVETRPLFGTGVNGAMIALEPRIVFDAAAATTAENLVDQAAEQQAAEALSSPLERSTTPQQADLDAYLEALDAVRQDATGRQEIAFIDGSVSNVLDLIAGIDPSVEVVLLDPTQDGVQQIADALDGRENIDAVHILSHGSSAELQLGNSVLNATSMERDYTQQLETIRLSLREGADLLIYGCNFGEGQAGAEASEMLARLTGADVGASEDPTGAAGLGGDWDLEVSTGLIEAEAIAAHDWDGILATSGPLTVS